MIALTTETTGNLRARIALHEDAVRSNIATPGTDECGVRGNVLMIDGNAEFFDV